MCILDAQSSHIMNLTAVYVQSTICVMGAHRFSLLNRFLLALPEGFLADSAWLQAQSLSRSSIRDYVDREGSKGYPRYFAGKVCAHHAANGLIVQQSAVCQCNTWNARSHVLCYRAY